MTDSIANCSAVPAGGTGTDVTYQHQWPRTTRRGVQVWLFVLWLLDGALQLQPFMFTANFAHQVVAPAAQGQPNWVAGPIDFLVRLIAAHPAPLNTGFALVQLALRVGFLIPVNRPVTEPNGLSPP